MFERSNCSYITKKPRINAELKTIRLCRDMKKFNPVLPGGCAEARLQTFRNQTLPIRANVRSLKFFQWITRFSYHAHRRLVFIIASALRNCKRVAAIMPSKIFHACLSLPNGTAERI